MDMNNKFRWPFSKNRQTWIETADRAISTAAREIDGIDGCGPLAPAHFRQYRRAARQYERSAKYYRKAGLGLMAAASWQDAAECYAAIGDDAEYCRCDEQERMIETYYEEDDDAS